MSNDFSFEYRAKCWGHILTAIEDNPTLGRNELLHHMLISFRWRHGITKQYLAEGKRLGYIATSKGEDRKHRYVVQQRP